ncbi:MAG: tyrosine-type recombinase/integrase [Flavobacteriales bacterium]|nr:tyrosine-type recombinase/integrase [Flavobacteriales bacterium]
MPLTQKFLDYLALEKRYSLHTIKAYKADLTLLSNYLDEVYSTSIEKANHSMIRSWLVNELNTGNSPRTVNRKITTLKSLFKFAEKEGVVKLNPTLKLTSAKTSKSIPSFVTVDEMNELLDKKKFSDDYVGKRNKLMVEIFYSTGIRLSELINIKISDVDFSKKQLKVLGKRNKERIIPLTQELVTSLEKFLDIRNSMKTNFTTYLLLTEKGKKLNPSLVYKTINDLISSVTSLKKTSPHILRHTFATHMLNSGADLNVIKELLGHASLSATEVYTHNSIEKLKKVFNNAHPRA